MGVAAAKTEDDRAPDHEEDAPAAAREDDDLAPDLVDGDDDRPRITDPDLLDDRERHKRNANEALLLPSRQQSRDQPPATRAAADHEIDLALETDRLHETEASPDLARDPDLSPDRKILPCTSNYFTPACLPNFSNLLKRNSRTPRFIEIDYHRSKFNASILGLHFLMKTAVS